MTALLARIGFSPLLPLWLLLLLAVIVILVLVILTWRGHTPLWRGLAMALALLVLANPVFIEERRQDLPDILLVLIDDSPSMAIGKRRQQRDAALQNLRRQSAEENGLRLAEYRVRGSLRDGTAMAATLREALSAIPAERLGGVVVISDGQVSDGVAMARLALKVPVHVLLVGDRSARDPRIAITRAPRFAILGEEQKIGLRIEDEGHDRAVTLTLSLNGEKRRIALPTNRDISLPFRLKRAGGNIISLSIPATEGELSTANNRALVTVNGVRDRLKVLLVSGLPYAGERVWRNLLKADPTVDLIHFTILRPPQKQDTTPIRELALIAFPIRELFELKLDKFDLVIFDRYSRRGVLPQFYLANIVRYVMDGGALLDVAGPRFASALSLYNSPLAELLPARPTGMILNRPFRPEPTRTGRRHPVTAGLPEPWGRWYRQAEAEIAPAMAGETQTLLSGNGGRPLLVLRRAGKGRVAQLLSDQIWLWARSHDGGGPHALLLRRLIHWLMQEPALEEEDLKLAIANNRLTVTRPSLQPRDTAAVIETPSGKRMNITLKTDGKAPAAATLPVDEPGVYRVSADGLTRLIAHDAGTSGEMRNLKPTAAHLKALAARTGGAILWPDDGQPRLRGMRSPRWQGAGWIGYRRNEQSRISGLRRFAPAAPAMMLPVLLLLILSWWREARDAGPVRGPVRQGSAGRRSPRNRPR